MAIGRAVGDFFGVTDESQLGGPNSPGWNQVAQMRAENGPVGFGTLRRSSSIRAPPDETPPDYNTLEMGALGTPYQSFDPDELSSSSDSDQEETFLDQAPPDYFSLPPTQLNLGLETTRVSVYGHEDPAGSNRLPTLLQIPEDQRTETHTVVEEEEFINDPDRAFQYYLQYMRAEQAVRQRRQRDNADEFFGGGREGRSNRSNGPQLSTSIRRERLNSTGDVDQRRRRGRRGGRTKLERQNTLVREKLQSLPTFWPIFIVGVTFLQVVAVVVLIVLQGLAPIHYEPLTHTDSYPSLLTEFGNASVTYYTFTNLWIGIGLLDLIHSGIKFTPCMRRDAAIINRNIQQRNREEDNGGLGCCQNTIWVGTTIRDECVVSEYPDLNNTAYLDQIPCEDTNALLANFHPCCISITGQCEVMHIRQCTDRGGIFHVNRDSCNDTNCMDGVCGFNGVGEDNGDPLRPVGNQIWRLLLSLFIHLGIIHVVIIGVVQLYLGFKIERTAGFLRVALVYIIAGVGGNLMSAIFIPYQINGGASPSVFGLLSVLFVELFQSWQIVDRAWLEVLKLTGILVFLLAVGTLPFIDNLANIGGFLFGIPAAIIFLPYITFGKWDAWRKRILLIICIPLLIIMYAVAFIVFYLVRDPDFCGVCHYFNCIPYTSGLCDNEIDNPTPDIFAL